MDKKKAIAPSAAVITAAAILTNVIWGAPFKIIKVMNAELEIDCALLGDHYMRQMLSVISIRFILAGLMTLVFAMCIGQNIFKVTKKQWGDVVLMGLVSTTAAHFFFNIGNVTISSTINSTILAPSLYSLL
ncbi:hypothetical protein DOK78_000609 [Enterococcus sp. DIV2402]|uniref:EamA domain-containing protein n=1 Tax=Candidatus Enterococcus lowellii TaxID=2230877 RepID=A0ABZ2SJG3_9ENTE|nr:EamA family transporter [Enterococcus sp. DIV2402]